MDRFITLREAALLVFKAKALAVLAAGLLIFGSANLAWAAQMEVNINPDSGESPFKIRYQRTAFIDYNNGGNLADQLDNKDWTISVNTDSSNAGVQDLISKLNEKLRTDGSSVRVSDLNVEYSAHMTGRAESASIDYRVLLEGQLTNYVIREGQGQSPAIIEMGWRGLTVTGPVVIDGVEINLPISALQQEEPDVYNQIVGTPAENLLSNPLIDAQGIKNQPLSNWHFLFDPTGISVDAAQFGLSGEIPSVVSGYTMGESSIREGRQVEKVLRAEFTSDKTYTVRTVQSADSANVHVIGFANLDNIEGTEVFGVTPRAPQGYGQTASGEFPVTIIYGMAGVGVVGAIAFFIFSSRQLKKEQGKGQSGIDPSHLRGYQTSASAGGYQTNRGEAQLASDSDYAQTRSVYDKEQSSSQESSNQSSRGSMPKGWKPES